MQYELITVKRIRGSYKVKVLEKEGTGQVILTVLGKNNAWNINGRVEEPSPALLKVLKEAQFTFEGTGAYEQDTPLPEQEPLVDDKEEKEEKKEKTFQEKVEEQKRLLEERNK